MEHIADSSRVLLAALGFGCCWLVYAPASLTPTVFVLVDGFVLVGGFVLAALGFWEWLVGLRASKLDAYGICVVWRRGLRLHLVGAMLARAFWVG
ncbi:hypothetical protein XM47_12755 [Catenovulum maritimum]|uniref:Uncharacterized protein n=2 Tax=Catenovulum maritimum TaxID=1513271 RepID=A0A0J8GTT2_9ALTE|nr:hypothetical protein XM47_12755 [Catenovulum maritimum]